MRNEDQAADWGSKTECLAAGAFPSEGKAGEVGPPPAPRCGTWLTL